MRRDFLSLIRTRPMIKKASYAHRLRIDLSSRNEEELFKWFLACLLFGKPIQIEIAERAFQELVAARLTNLGAVIRAGWDNLVRLLDRAHYVIYDFPTATKLLGVCEELKRCYGTLTNLLAQTRIASELSRRSQEFKHIGPVTTRIVLRDVRPIWYRSAALEKGT